MHILDVTTDNFFMRWIDAIVRNREPEHVRFYSSAEFKRMFVGARLSYDGSKTLLLPEKVHSAHK